MVSITERYSTGVGRPPKSPPRQVVAGSTPKQGLYLRASVPWLAAAGLLSLAALKVGLALWFMSSVRKGSKKGLRLCPGDTGRLGCSVRSARRGLAALERAGLVAVERHSGRCPRVTILEVGE